MFGTRSGDSMCSKIFDVVTSFAHVLSNPSNPAQWKEKDECWRISLARQLPKPFGITKIMINF